MSTEIHISQEVITEFCERNHIRRLMMFGEETRDTFDLGENDMYIVFKDGHEQEAKSKHIYALQAELRNICLLYTSPSPRDGLLSRMPSSA